MSVTYYHVQVLYLWITSSYKYKAFLPQTLLFLDIFYPILFSERSSADFNIWTLSVLTDGGGCVNLLITSCTARLALPTELIGERGGVSSAGRCPDCSYDLYMWTYREVILEIFLTIRAMVTRCFRMKLYMGLQRIFVLEIFPTLWAMLTRSTSLIRF